MILLFSQVTLLLINPNISITAQKRFFGEGEGGGGGGKEGVEGPKW